ncbi:MAG: hypothetical protein M0Z71_02745 [Nitrospiraceae bacterium]|nr:hypothetical protein [Nitrospiraceae bacterium]
MPALPSPCFVRLQPEEARSLLKKSRAWFIRYESEPCERETEWWHVLCDSYSPDKLSSKVRNIIKHGNRNCSIRPVDAEWLAANGYECYSAAYTRYTNARPLKRELFNAELLKTAEGPFEYWGVFVKESLAGYCQCIVEKNEAATNIVKYHPAFLKYQASYALITAIITHYVLEKGMTVSNGTRSIVHDTKFQDFLLKLGFRRQFCRLNIVYQPWMEFAIKTLFPFRNQLLRLPAHGPVNNLRAILYQEDLRRTCNVR